jgi:hypothetical protein
MSFEPEQIEIISVETIPETKEIILNDTVTIQNELKKLTPLERIQILNKIIKEEEAEEIMKIQKQEQLEKNAARNEENNMSRNGCKMFINSKAILTELQNLRMQMNDLQNEVKFMNRNNSILQNQMSSCYKKDEITDYCSENSCNLISFVIDWMPFWIFISIVLFAFIGKPSRMCSISGSVGSAIGSAAGSAASGVCPFTGLGSLGEFVTKM